MSTRSHVDSRVEVVELDADEARAAFDRLARDRLGLSGPEFLAAYDAGRFDPASEQDMPGLTDVVMELPFAR